MRVVGRLDKLPPYLFSAIDAAKAAAVARGVEVVDLGLGDPDLPTPAALVKVMAAAVADPANHCYPTQRGELALRETIAAWLAARYGVQADPATEILVLIGSKEGLGHLPLSCVEEGDNTLVPDVGYPVYGQATLLAGGQPRPFSLKAANGYLPDPAELDTLMDDRSRLLFLNYPHNPTGSVAGPDFWREMVALTHARNVILVNDAAYLEVSPAGRRQTSLLEVADHKVHQVIELHSLSKMFNMTGWRIAFAVGHAEVVGNLARVKESMDSGVFTAVQETARFALGDQFDSLLAEVLAPYARRRQVVEAALQKAGFMVYPAAATFYVWARVPGDEAAVDFCGRALTEIGVVLTPGPGFGSGGEGWFRISLTAGDADIDEGARRLEAWS